MKLLGIVLWWDDIDQNGIIKTKDGRKFYCDASVLKGRATVGLASKDIVKFEQNIQIAHTLCAVSVSLASEREAKAYSILELKMTA